VPRSKSSELLQIASKIVVFSPKMGHMTNSFVYLFLSSARIHECFATKTKWSRRKTLEGTFGNPSKL
jgi:hypothetical protein